MDSCQVERGGREMTDETLLLNSLLVQVDEVKIEVEGRLDG